MDWTSVFRRVVVPAEVGEEIATGGGAQFACAEFDAATWVDKRKSPVVLPPYLLTTLDRGEAAVIALALAEKIPTACIDEAVGRRVSGCTV